MCGGVIGGAGGAISGVSHAWVGSVGRPRDKVIGSVANAILAGLAGAVSGCVTGAQAGRVIDANILKNHQCLKCKHEFGSGVEA